MKRGFTIRPVGIGDGVQFTSLPENYFRETNVRLVDVSRPWYLDHNPFIDRETVISPEETVELWNYPKKYEWPHVRSSAYLSNAEIHASVFGVNPKLIRPRLYRYEDFAFEKREMILLHTVGRSQGAMPDQVIDHVIQKYKRTGRLFHIGIKDDPAGDPDLGIPKIHPKDHWELAEVISRARMLIGVDSGPSWIAACYPDVVVKKVRIKFQSGFCESPYDWVPLDVKNPHSFWDDRMFQIHNIFEDDLGFTLSYRKI